MADGKTQTNQSSDDLDFTDGIEFIPGDTTNILLIAPHGVESPPLDDIGTAELTRQISAHLGCTAIINPTFRKPEGSQPDKRNNGEPSFKAEVLNLNLVDQVKQHPLFTELIEMIVKEEGLTYVFWIHGIDKNHIDSGIDCYLGYGQPNIKDKEESRYTAEKGTIDKTINQLNKSGIRTVLAPENSGYRGWKETYMNQWLKLEGYDFTQAQSIQLEFRKTGIRGKDDIKLASKKIADAISAIIAPDKPKTTPNVDENSGETKIPSNSPPEKSTAPAKTEDDIDEKGPSSSQPAGKVAVTEAGTEPATEEKIPAQDTAPIQKMTETDDREGAIDVGEGAITASEDEKAMVKANNEADIVGEDPLVEEAYSVLFGIFSRHYENAMMEAGFYIIKTFYGNDIDNARDNNPTHEQTLNQLYEKIEENKNPNSASRSKLYHAKNLVVQEDDLCMCLDKDSFSTFRNLSLSHKIYLLSVKGIEKKKKLIEHVSTQQLSVRELQEEIKRSRSNDPSPLQLINNPEKIWEGQNIEFLNFDRLIKRSPMELKKYLKALASEKGTYEKYLKKFTDIEANLERAIKYSQTKPKRIIPKIISVSRRTDIPALYSDWFFNRIKAGYVQVKGKIKNKSTKKVILTPEQVRCFVFWTKNPGPMMDRLDELKDYYFYFQFTLTPYGKDLEKNLPSKDKLVGTFIQLSKKIGKEKVIWRYDPILRNDKIDIEYHKTEFKKLAKNLQGHTDKCVISFVDTGNISAEIKEQLKLKKITNDMMRVIGQEFQAIGNECGIKIETCAEKIDLTEFGITPAKCIDDKIIGTIIGENLSIAKDKSQRKECGCVESIDIGTYDTCLHGCSFCYATKDEAQARVNYTNHDKDSPLLIGKMPVLIKSKKITTAPEVKV